VVLVSEIGLKSFCPDEFRILLFPPFF